MSKRRAVITGIGAVTSIGTGRQEFWDSLVAGRSGAGPITRFDASAFAVRIAGEVPDFVPTRYLSRREVRRYPRFALFSGACARLAIEDSGLDVSRGSVGACFASSISGGGEIADEEVPAFEDRGVTTLNPISAASFTPHVSTSLVCQSLGLTGPKSTMAAGCTSGIEVLGWARRQIEDGAADAVVVGAADAPLYPFVFGLLCAGGVYSPTLPAPRPFDFRHNGTLISEGGGAIVVEEARHAEARKATIYAEVLGLSSSGEGDDFLKPATGGGAERALLEMMHDARLSPLDFDAISPFALGVPSVDTTECSAIRAALGSHAYHIPAPSIFSCIGHMISASSMMQIIAMALALHHQQVPPTIHFERAAPGCDLDCVPNQARFSRLRKAAILSRSLSRTFASAALGAWPARST